MALQTTSLGSFNDDSVTASYTYDDVTHVITSIAITNNGATGTMSAKVTSLDGQTVLFQGSRAFNTGTVSHTVSIPMTEVTGIGKNGLPFDSWIAPFNTQLDWSSV